MLGDPSNSGTLGFLSETRQFLLIAIKNRGPATTEELSRDTHLSAGAVRQHLLALEAQGLVTFDRLRDGPGRPRHMFRLTGHGEDLFPQQYAKLAGLLFTAIESEDAGVRERVLQRLVEAQVELVEANVQGDSTAERLLEVAHLIEGYGYFPLLELVDDSPATMSLRHCPLLSLARRHPHICQAEADALRVVLPGAGVRRTLHRLDGDAICQYTVANPPVAAVAARPTREAD